MGKQYEDEADDEQMTVTLYLDNDETVECAILTILEVDGQDYIALLPTGDDEDGSVYLYRYLETPEGEPSLENILDDDEYEKVVDAFDEWLDSQEYDEIVGEDELED